MDNFIEELKKDFLAESFELISELEKCLLSLEENPNDENLINEIFRIVHTIKGGAGSVGFEEINKLSHAMEDVFDLVRKKILILSKENIDTLLECKDEIELMMQYREKNEIYNSEKKDYLIDYLYKIKNSNKINLNPEPTKTENIKNNDFKELVKSIPITNYEVSLINDFILKNKNIYFLFYKLNSNYELKDVSAFQIYALLKDISEIIKIHPSLDELQNKFFEEIYFIIQSDKDINFIIEKTNLTEMIIDKLITKISINEFKIIEEVFQSETKQTDNQPSIKQEIKEEQDITQTKDIESQEKNSEDSIQKRNISTLRIESSKIDELINLLGELVITKANFSQLNYEFDKITRNIKYTLKEFISGIIKLNLPGDNEVVKEKNQVLYNTINDLLKSIDLYSELIQKFNRISSDLQENVMNLRMIPIQMVFSRFPRIIRDLADKLGKKVDLIIEGVETEIDKGMVDDLFDPLIHLLRNAIDHGIEEPEERIKLGKPEVGKVVLKANHEGDSIIIEVSDDGKGIEIDKIKNKAIEMGFITKDYAERISNKEILDLIALPGLSTAKKVSELSGRGVGMDVVKKKIEEIGGAISIFTEKGKGTRFVIKLPLTLAIIQGLLIVVNQMFFAIPIASVEETVVIDLKQIKDINGRLMFELRGKFIPVIFLNKYFYGEEIIIEKEENNNNKEYCIISHIGENLIGIIVSEVIGEQDIVIKQLNTKLIKSPGISAATIIGNGEIGYILDIPQIVNNYFKE